MVAVPTARRAHQSCVTAAGCRPSAHNRRKTRRGRLCSCGSTPPIAAGSERTEAAGAARRPCPC
eukprot:3677308-Prymnesium_polylepis.1